MMVAFGVEVYADPKFALGIRKKAKRRRIVRTTVEDLNPNSHFSPEMR
jgi:hypothetical protein